MIRAGRGGVYAADWLERGIVGIGWDFGGADIAGMNREKIRAAYAAAHPSESKQKVAANVGQIYRFAHCMAQGSTVVMYDPAERLYHIGDIIAARASPQASPKASPIPALSNGERLHCATRSLPHLRTLSAASRQFSLSPTRL